jgi:hypothetical protein
MGMPKARVAVLKRGQDRRKHNKSAYPLIADMEADIAERQRSAIRRHSRCNKIFSFDHLIGILLKVQRYLESKGLGDL